MDETYERGAKAIPYEWDDSVMFLTEDVSYVAKHIDDHLTVFLHPQEQHRIVGARIEGFERVAKSMVDEEKYDGKRKLRFADTVAHASILMQKDGKLSKDAHHAYAKVVDLAVRKRTIIPRWMIELTLQKKPPELPHPPSRVFFVRFRSHQALRRRRRCATRRRVAPESGGKRRPARETTL